MKDKKQKKKQMEEKIGKRKENKTYVFLFFPWLFLVLWFVPDRFQIRKQNERKVKERVRGKIRKYLSLSFFFFECVSHLAVFFSVQSNFEPDSPIVPPGCVWDFVIK